MANATQESLEDFINRRVLAVDEEARVLRDALAVLEEERRKLMAAAEAAANFAAKKADAGPVVHIDGAPYEFKRSRPVAAEKTIKQAVLEILGDVRRGMTALEILPAVNAKLGVDYPRTSLSPQLSRLKNDGLIERKGIVWSLVSRKLEQDGSRALDLGQGAGDENGPNT